MDALPLGSHETVQRRGRSDVRIRLRPSRTQTCSTEPGRRATSWSPDPAATRRTVARTAREPRTTRHRHECSRAPPRQSEEPAQPRMPSTASASRRRPHDLPVQPVRHPQQRQAGRHQHEQHQRADKEHGAAVVTGRRTRDRMGRYHRGSGTGDGAGVAARRRSVSRVPPRAMPLCSGGVPARSRVRRGHARRWLTGRLLPRGRRGRHIPGGWARHRRGRGRVVMRLRGGGRVGRRRAPGGRGPLGAGPRGLCHRRRQHG